MQTNDWLWIKNTWNHLTIWKKWDMEHLKVLSKWVHGYLIYMYIQDLLFDNLQCKYVIKPNQANNKQTSQLLDLGINNFRFFFKEIVSKCLRLPMF